jgi:hypothetical protein
METQGEFAMALSWFRKKTEALGGSAYSFSMKRDVELSRDQGRMEAF